MNIENNFKNRLYGLLAILAVIGGIYCLAFYKSNEQVIKDTMATVLKDADGAKYIFSKPKTDYSGIKEICAKINAKNGFGAYAGYTTYYFKIMPSGLVGYSKMGDTEIGSFSFKCYW